MSDFLAALFLIAESEDDLDDRGRDLLHSDPRALVGELLAEPPKFDYRIERRRKGLAAVPALLRDNTDLSADELYELAEALSPGGAHDGGFFVAALILNGGRWDYCNRLLAAIVHHNWTGGKAGFQFMPDPQEADVDEYQSQADELQGLLIDGGPPESFLTGDDLAFYQSLPDVVTIYRGVSGIPLDIAQMGFCWTTDKRYAEWFAHRHANDARPALLLMARVAKRHILLAHAMESEVVTLAGRARQIKYGPKPERPRSWEPSP